MKIVFTRVLGVAVVVGMATLTANAQINQNFTGTGTYTGNAGAGFGGTVGNSSLTLSYAAGTGTINGSFAPSGTFSPTANNNLVLYIGTGATGIANTSTLTDNADGGRTAISGLSGNGRTLASFSAGFRPTYALSIDPTFAGLFNLSTPTNFGFVSSANITGTGTGPFTFSFPVTALGLTASASNNIDFVGTLISTSAYRSNETFGTSVTVAGTPGDAPNAGFTGTQTFSNFNRFRTFAPTVVPEANAAVLALLALPVLGAVAARRRK